MTYDPEIPRTELDEILDYAVDYKEQERSTGIEGTTAVDTEIEVDIQLIGQLLEG